MVLTLDSLVAAMLAAHPTDFDKTVMPVFYIVLDKVRESRFARRSVAAVPPVYRQRVESMTSMAARARTVAGLWLLEQGLNMIGFDTGRMRCLGFAPGGRPVFSGGPSFSISHSEQLVACALDHDNTVGLDVERQRGGIQPRLQHSIAPTGDFFEAWCAREATVKASGHVGLARIRAVELDGSVARLDGRDWHLFSLMLAPGYTACVASDHPRGPAGIICKDIGDRIDFD